MVPSAAADRVSHAVPPATVASCVTAGKAASWEPKSAGRPPVVQTTVAGAISSEVWLGEPLLLGWVEPPGDAAGRAPWLQVFHAIARTATMPSVMSSRPSLRARGVHLIPDEDMSSERTGPFDIACRGARVRSSG